MGHDFVNILPARSANDMDEKVAHVTPVLCKLIDELSVEILLCLGKLIEIMRSEERR